MSFTGRLTPGEILPFDEAERCVLERVGLLCEEEIPATFAHGRVLTKSIVAGEAVPSFDASTVDGFAMHAVDLEHATPETPRILNVVGQVPAGSVWPSPLEKGTAVRIFTGSPVPEGADCVVMFEWCTWNDQEVAVGRRASTRANIRGRAEDIDVGDQVLERGHRMRPPDLGILASLGVTHVRVAKRPCVAYVMTGSELVRPGDPIRPGAVRSSNQWVLHAQIEEVGGVPLDLGYVPDDDESLERCLRGAQDFDVLLTSGGVSVGDHDHVKDTFGRMGMNCIFWRVASSPGKPLWFGTWGSKFVFGLPGNPVSSMVCFENFVRPALLGLQGASQVWRRRMGARLAADIQGAGPRRHFARVRLEQRDGETWAYEVGPRGSGNLRSMVQADALAIIPEGRGTATQGSLAEVILLDS